MNRNTHKPAPRDKQQSEADAGSDLRHLLERLEGLQGGGLSMIIYSICIIKS